MWDIFKKQHEQHSDRELLLEILANQHLIISQNVKIMSQQDQLNADVAAIQSALTGISSDVSAIQAEIASLQSQLGSGATLDLSALDALAAQAASVKTAVDGLIPASSEPAASN